MTTVEINLEQRFAKKLGMRTTAIQLFNELKDDEDVVLDFKDVEFMSRSFAQEYVHQKHLFKSKIIESNMSEFIKGLVAIVQEDYEETCLNK